MNLWFFMLPPLMSFTCSQMGVVFISMTWNVDLQLGVSFLPQTLRMPLINVGLLMLEVDLVICKVLIGLKSLPSSVLWRVADFWPTRFVCGQTVLLW